MSDLKDELEQERREKEWAETWKPEAAGDMLIGTLEGYDEATTDFGTYTVAHIRNEDGVLKGLWLMHSVLQDEWGEAEPQKGDRVGAMYHGKRTGDTYDYHMWSVRVDHSEQTGAGSEDSHDAAADRQPQAPGGSNSAPQEPTESETAGPSLDDPNSELPF